MIDVGKNAASKAIYYSFNKVCYNDITHVYSYVFHKNERMQIFKEGKCHPQIILNLLFSEWFSPQEFSDINTGNISFAIMNMYER